MIFGYSYENKAICELIGHTNNAVVLLPYRGKLDGDKIEDNYYSLSLIIALVDVKTGKILNHYFHKNVVESSSIALQNIVLDTSYSRLSKFTPFAVKLSVGNPSSHTIYYDNEQLYLYEFRKHNSMKVLIDGVVLSYAHGLCDDYNLCKIDYAEVKVMFSKNKKPYAPIEVNAKLFSTLRLPSVEILELKSEEKFEQYQLIYRNGHYVEKKV